MLDIQLDSKSEQVMLFLLSQYDSINAKGYSIYLPNDNIDIEYAELKQICEDLSSINFINCHFTHGMKQIKIFITRRGIAYFEQKKLVEQQLQEQAAKDKQIQKEQRQHEYRLTLFNIIGGGIAGLITSLIFWLITK